MTPIRALALIALLAQLAPPARAADPDRDRRAEGGDAGPASQDDLLYALGALLGQKIAAYRLGPRELAQVRSGFADAAAGRKLRLRDPDLEEWGPRVDAMMARRTKPEVARTKDQGRAFADAAAKEPGAVRLPSGIVLRRLSAGTGPSPSRTAKVKVSYTGKLIDGTVFDSSQAHGGPVEFPLGQVIPCWTEGVSRMQQGEKARLVCPAAAAYGDQGRPPQIPPGATLVFDIELLAVR